MTGGLAPDQATDGDFPGSCALAHLFPRHADWLLAVDDLAQRLRRAVDALPPPSDASSLARWLADLDSLQRDAGRVSTYAGVRAFVDTRHGPYQADAARARELSADVAQLVAALAAHLSAIDEQAWLALEREAPVLALHTARAARLREDRPHRLTAETEQVLAALDPVLQLPVQVYRRVKAGDLRYPGVRDNAGRTHAFTLPHYEKLFETSADGVLREQAYRAFATAVRPHGHAFAAAYAGEVGRQVRLARLRGFQRTTDLLFWQQGISSAFFEAQRAAFAGELPRIMRRFAALRQRMLGLPVLRFQDLKAYPPQLARTVSLTQARAHIVAAGRQLGDDYAAVLEQAFDEGWIEHAQHPAKADSSGCANPLGPHPYVLMTWTGTPRDLFLLAHELGHAVHFQWSQQHQVALDVAPLRYFIEAPSTLNELLLAEHLLAEGEPEDQASVIFELLNSYYHNFVTHHLESEFQWRVYALADQGHMPGAEALQRIKTGVLREFWGDAVAVDDDAGLTWLRQHHYYMGLYPYTYAAGQSVATLFFRRLRAGQAAAGDWCDSLRLGSARDAGTLLQGLGLDLTDPGSFRLVLSDIERLVDRLDALTVTAPPFSAPVQANFQETLT